MSTPTPQSTEENAGSTVDAKILADLAVVEDRMDLCTKMLHPGDGSPAPSLRNNDALLQVIGFLEACGPRMVELVEAATQGALSEAVLMECLSVNDRLLKLLADIDTYAFTETPATTTAASVPLQQGDPDYGDLLLDDSADARPVKPSNGTKSTGEDDPFAGPVDLLTPSPIGEASSNLPVTNVLPAQGETEDSKMPPAQQKDDFDDFFAERTGN